LPRYCAATTAPPVAMAEKSWVSSTLMLSTSEIALTALSDTVLTITVSAMPINSARNCSITSGIISLRRSRSENSLSSTALFVGNTLPLFLRASFAQRSEVFRHGQGCARQYAQIISRKPPDQQCHKQLRIRKNPAEQHRKAA